MTHASVFSGIGGPEVAAAMLGWENLFHCEINPFGRTVLQYWFPNAKSYEDITTTDFSEWGGRVNVLTGGFPCQPFSYAGQRRGADDDRYLWPYMHRCINQVRPDWVVCENVAGITTMVEQGDVTEMAAEKSLFDEGDTLYRYRLDETFTLERICEDLEGDGYSVQAFIIPACAVGAPHRRDRVFIIGNRNDAQNTMRSGQLHGQYGIAGSERDIRNACTRDCERVCGETSGVCVPDPIRTGLEGQGQPRCGETGERVHLWRDPARCDRQDDKGRRIVGVCNNTGKDEAVLQPKRVIFNTADKRQGRPFDGRTTGEVCCKIREEGHHAELCIPIEASSGDGFVADTDYGRLSQRMPGGECEDAAQSRAGLYDSTERPCNDGKTRRCREYQVGERWADFPTVSPVHRGNDGIPFPLDDLTISPSKWRTESLKAYGNAIVPQVMYEIFKAIEETYK